MEQTSTLERHSGEVLRENWLALKQSEPATRARDAAEKLGVSEAELVACRCGDGVRRLRGPWGDLVRLLPALGEVMALTRNEHVVHEKTGRFGNISVHGSMGLVLNRDIDLRILLKHWASGYAVTERTAGGERHSLQFFAADGTAIHKIYVPKDGDVDGYEALVDGFLDDDQSPAQAVTGLPAPRPEKPDSEIRVSEMRDAWLSLEDVHDFMILLRKYKVGRVQSMRLVGDDMAWQVTPESFVRALEEAAATSLSIMVFVGSPGVIQIHTGPVSNLKRVNDWFNVLDPGFNLHLKDADIASAWVVRKPTKDGIVTSVEIFDAENEQIALMFGERKEGQPENPAWRTLAENLERLSS